MCIKEHYKSKRQELEELLQVLHVPRWTWYNSNILTMTLQSLSCLTLHRRLVVVKAAKLVKEIYQ